MNDTYRTLRDKLNQLPDEQLDLHVSILDAESEIYQAKLEIVSPSDAADFGLDDVPYPILFTK